MSEIAGLDKREPTDGDAPSLSGFLRARYDERERKAKAAAADYAQDSGMRWRIDIEGNIHPADPVDNSVVAVGGWGGGVDEATGLHIVDNDPQNVLADLESKRAVLDELHQQINAVPSDPSDLDAEGWVAGHAAAAERLLHLLALPFASHPDYQEGWKP